MVLACKALAPSERQLTQYFTSTHFTMTVVYTSLSEELDEEFWSSSSTAESGFRLALLLTWFM